jgi:hypothetical protein
MNKNINYIKMGKILNKKDGLDMECGCMDEEMLDRIRELVVESDMKKNEYWVKVKVDEKNERLMSKYGKVIEKVKMNLKIVEELGVVKGMGWDMWKNEVSGEREIELVRFGSKVKEVVDDGNVWKVRKFVGNICDVCSESVCRLDWVMDEKMIRKMRDEGKDWGYVGKMLVGSCGKKWNFEMKKDEFGVENVEGVLEGVWSEIIDGDRMERKEESDRRYEEFVKNWNDGVFLRKWKIRNMKELDEKVKNKGRMIVERLNRMLNEKKVVDGVEVIE